MAKKLYAIFDAKQRRTIVLLFFLILLGGLFETLGVSMIVPFVSAITAPETIYRVVDEHPLLSSLARGMGLYEPVRMILTLLFALIVIFIVKNLFLLFQVYRQNTFVTRARNEMISRVMREFLNRPYEEYLEADIPTTFRITDSDIPKTFSLVLAVLSLGTEVTVSIFLGLVLIAINWEMTVFIIAIFLLMTFINWKVLKPRLHAIGKKDQETASRIAKWRIEAIYGLKDVKVLNRQDFFIRNYYESGRVGADIGRDYAVLNSVPRIVIETSFIVSVLGFIAVYILAGGDVKVLIPQLTAFAIAAVRLMPSANRINTYITEIAYEQPALDFVYDNLTEGMKRAGDMHATRRERRGEPLSLRDRIELENITFRYPGGERNIFTDASMEIPRGRSVGIMGASGAGKSTIVDILLGLLHAQSGEILCDGVSIFDDYDSWLAQVGYIPQQIYLVDETIRDNIAFGIDADRIDDARIRQVLKEAQLLEFVDSLPEGLDTRIGDRGVRLSGGQRQRIGIARALYHDPEILVFDEATSALDGETEEALMEAINSFHGRKTMIIIAHRLNTIEKCDMIYEVKNERICPATLEGRHVLHAGGAGQAQSMGEEA